MAPIADQDIMSAVKEDHLEQMEYLYDRHKQALMGFFYRLTGGDRIQSEDLVHNVFLRALKYRHSFRDGAAVKPWLFQLARNVFYDHSATRKLYRASTEIEEWKDPVSLGRTDGPDLTIEQQERHRFLNMAMNRLPVETRELIILCKYQELPYRQVAEMLDTSEGNIKVKLHRAIKKLGAIYQKLTFEAYES